MAQLKQGVVQTRISVTKLNHIVVTALAQKVCEVISMTALTTLLLGLARDWVLSVC
jgi:isopentenyl phosphate kinase